MGFAPELAVPIIRPWNDLVPDARHAQPRAGSLRGEIELEVTIFLGVRRKVIGPDRDLTPLEALADIPVRLLAGAPGREMVELPAQFAKPLAANPFLRVFF